MAAIKVRRIRYPISRYILSRTLPTFKDRWYKYFIEDCSFDKFMVDLAAREDSGIRGRIIRRGLRSYRLEYESLTVQAPFGAWLFNLK